MPFSWNEDQKVFHLLRMMHLCFTSSANEIGVNWQNIVAQCNQCRMFRIEIENILIMTS